MASAIFMSYDTTKPLNANNLPPLKLRITVQCSESNNHTMELDCVFRKLSTGQRAELYTGKTATRNGSIEVKIARASGLPVNPRHVRIKGNSKTTAPEIAGQLNVYFAEE